MNVPLDDVSLCIVNYNGRDYLPACLGALQAICPVRREIIIVDNASEDYSAETAVREISDARVIRLPENRGPAAARNAGYAEAAGRYVLFVDNDIQLTARCAAELLAAIRSDPTAAVAMPRVCYLNRPEIIQYDGAGSHPLGLMILHHQEMPAAEVESDVRPLSSVVTACILVDRRKLAMDRPFDEDFFFNYEDHDFGFRCRIAGHSIIAVPRAVCHHGAGTTGLSYRPGSAYAADRVYYLVRNRWQILLKNYQLSTLIMLSPALLLYEFAMFAGVLINGWIYQWFRSAGWIIRNIRRIYRKRRIVQASRQIGDFDIFEPGPLPLTEGVAGTDARRRLIKSLDKVIGGYWNLLQRVRTRQADSRD